MTQERLKFLFDYHPDGYFIHTGRGYKRAFKGRKTTGSLYKSGRKMITIDSKIRMMSRMVFLWHRGYLPPQVDHINRIKDDDRIENLRAATAQLNQANTFSSRNKSGFKGVHKCSSTGKWVASIRCNGRAYSLGSYLEKSEAGRAYDKKAKEFFGDFAYLNFAS